MSDAWKIRAIVYGMLLVVAALVLVPRLTASGDAQLPKRETLWGYTAQRSDIVVGLHGRHIDKVLVYGIRRTCDHGWDDYMSVRVPTRTARYRDEGGDITIGLGSSPSSPGGLVTIRARLNSNTRSIDGTISSVSERNGARCDSGPIAFSATR